MGEEGLPKMDSSKLNFHIKPKFSLICFLRKVCSNITTIFILQFLENVTGSVYILITSLALEGKYAAILAYCLQTLDSNGSV